MVESGTLIATLLGEKGFQPLEAQNLEQAGISETLVESLICKHLKVLGNASGHSLAECICLPFRALEERFQRLRSRQWLTHTGAAPLNDYVYALTDHGREQAALFHKTCAYLGPAPVPLNDYITSVDAQTIATEAPKRQQLEEAFRDISVNPSMFARLGPAVNSGAGLFLYGAPGNGKTTLAERVTLCFGQEIWIPKALIADGEIIKLYDPAYHHQVNVAQTRLLRQDCLDQRWIKVRRPTVIVGGELTLDCLEIRHDPRTNTSEAPLQLKSNCGSLLIDDFGRQRLDPMELLNRWIVPLENHHDFLTLSTGKKIQVPFEQLIIFSTNLEPSALVDEAFLRRIPYKIEVHDPDAEEFHYLFQLHAGSMGFACRREDVDYLIEKHYRPQNRAMRRCHPRDLLHQVRNYCVYNDLPIETRREYFDRVIGSYFAMILKPSN
jgi:predicted ATPase with chaperone activity